MSNRLPQIEEDILAALSRNAEWCLNYTSLESQLGTTRKYLEPAITHLRKEGYIEHWKGLMTEDGEVAGSGWCRSRKGNEYVYVEEHKL